MLAIITGTIKPDQQVGQLQIRDEKERLRQYTDGLSFLIKSKAFEKIVFCENSSYGVESMTSLCMLAKEHNVELELFSFQGDSEQTRIHGKGYGEGEILEYVLKNSVLVQKSDYFVKITGRMRVDNIKDITGRLKRNRTYFNVPNHMQRDVYDTRIYAMPLQQFRDCFRNAYMKVMDDKGYYLEHAYTDVLRDQGIKVTNFPRYPRIVGVSGSTGMQYGYTEWKCKIKDVISFWGGYKV